MRQETVRELTDTLREFSDRIEELAESDEELERLLDGESDFDHDKQED